jgi:hypothetical protein
MEPTYSDSYSSSTIQERTPNGMITRTITDKSSLKDGRRTSTRTEEITNPDGTRDITETIDEDGNRRVNTCRLEPGMSRPHMLTHDTSGGTQGSSQGV